MCRSDIVRFSEIPELNKDVARFSDIVSHNVGMDAMSFVAQNQLPLERKLLGIAEYYTIKKVDVTFFTPNIITPIVMWCIENKKHKILDGLPSDVVGKVSEIMLRTDKDSKKYVKNTIERAECLIALSKKSNARVCCEVDANLGIDVMNRITKATGIQIKIAQNRIQKHEVGAIYVIINRNGKCISSTTMGHVNQMTSNKKHANINNSSSKSSVSIQLQNTQPNDDGIGCCSKCSIF